MNSDAPEDYEISLSDELKESRAAIILKPKNSKQFVPGKPVLRLEVSRRRALRQSTAARAEAIVRRATRTLPIRAAPGFTISE